MYSGGSTGHRSPGTLGPVGLVSRKVYRGTRYARNISKFN